MAGVDEVRADPDVAVDEVRASRSEDRAETRDAPVNSDDVADCTGPVDRRDPPADLSLKGYPPILFRITSSSLREDA